MNTSYIGRAAEAAARAKANRNRKPQPQPVTNQDLLECVKCLYGVVSDVLPQIGQIVLQDYERLFYASLTPARFNEEDMSRRRTLDHGLTSSDTTVRYNRKGESLVLYGVPKWNGEVRAKHSWATGYQMLTYPSLKAFRAAQEALYSDPNPTP